MTGIPVLLIDDSETDRLFTGIVLARAGLPFDIREYESASAALADLARAPTPRVLVLLDINMPGMDGFAFLDACEKLPESHRNNLVVVMLSSSPLDSDRQRALAHAMVKDYVVKPITLPWASRLVGLFGASP